MKKILLTLVLLIGIVVGLFAQKLTYQAVIRDNNQQLVVNTAVKATVTITFTTGVPYAEEVNGSTNIHGLLSFEFGDETLAGRDWTGATIAVKVVNAATPSTVYVNDEARPVSAVPYALNVNGQSIQNYLTAHNYVDETELDSRHYLTSDSTVITTMQGNIATNANNITTNANNIAALANRVNTFNTNVCDSVATCIGNAIDARGFLTSDSAVITTMQGNIANLTQHTTKSAIRDSVAGQIHDSIADIAAKSHTHGNKDLLDTYNQTNADLADAVAKKHAHDNAAVLAATTAPYTDADSIKLKGIAEGAEVNVQADWNQSTTTADDYIKNKPTIPTVPTNVSAFNNDAGYITATDVPAQVNADWNATSGTAQILNKPELFSGNYNDLSNKPTIPTVPTNVSAFSNDAGYITATDVPAQVNADWNATSGTAQILNKPELFSGNYNDLSNKPTIPAAANNATLTIQKNGTSVGTFTADASSDKSINITVPTTTSELTNNSGFITTANVPTNVSQLNNDAGYVSNSNCPTVDLCELYNMMTSLQNTIARQDSMINALNNEHHSFTCGTSTVSDHEGNVYNTVKIGTQCWMAQNLRTSTNAAGAGNIYTPTASEVPGYDVNTYGRLYDWAAVMQGASSSDAVPSGVQGICPTGWHVPSDAEWTQLTTYVKSKSEYQCDGADNIANALSAAIGWSYNTSEGCYAGSISSTINLTGFSAVPAGLYKVRSLDFSHSAFFWSTTEYDSNNAYYRNLSSNNAEVSRWDFSKDYGHSVRCLRDASIGGGDNPSEPATMSCEQVMECMGDTLGQLNAKIEAQGAEIETLNGTVTSQGQTIETLNSTVESQGNTIDSLAHLVDSLSNLIPGGEPTATFTCGTDSIKDVDNNWYHTVKIGEQCWTKENLRTTKKPNNEAITGGMWEPGTNSVETYGRLYSWTTMMNGESSSEANPSGVQGICPDGWHVPSKAEWTALTDYVNTEANGYRCGDDGTIANALSSSTGWQSPRDCGAGHNSTTLNATGFSAVPAGFCPYGEFHEFGYFAYFWSATQSADDDAWCLDLGSFGPGVYWGGGGKDDGLSVRCVRDADNGGGDTAETTLTLTTDKSSATVKLCGAASVSVTYTATVENGTATEYAWSTSGGTPTASTTNTYTVNYATTGTYTVTCTAAGITATKSVEIASGGTAPALGLCEDCNAGSITVKTSTNVASIVWRNEANDSVSNSTTGLTQSATIPAGNYSATAASSDGCTVTRTATLGNATSHPCTVASIRSNESGTGTQLDSVSDHQNNWYRVVEINGQCWLAENMRCTTSPRQGTVNLQSGGTSGTDYDHPKYYDDNSTDQVVTNSRARGLLYNWVAAMDTMYTFLKRPGAVNFPNRRGICPEGWHLPTDDEWFMLEKNVLTNASWASVTSASGSDIGFRGTGAGKLTGGCVWSSSTNTTAPNNYSYADRNNTGFSALPVGYYYGSFTDSGNYAYFWSATSNTTERAWHRGFGYGDEGVYRDYYYHKYSGLSVRCVRD